MKEFFTVLKQIAKVSSTKFNLLASAGIAAGILGISMIALAGWSPDRQVYDWNNTADRNGSMDGPRLNAFINTPYYGDERAFFDARRTDQATGGDVYKDVLDNVTEGSRRVVLRTYVHNGANQSTNESGVGVANGVKVRIDLPTGTSNTLRARSYISADNSAPSYPREVTDTAELIDNVPFAIRYVPGTAKIYTGALNGAALSDSIVGDGALIGYDGINGNLPGCFEFQAIVEIEVDVLAAGQKFEKVVRKAGDQNYGETTTVKPGDKIQWRLFWDNSGTTNTSDVVIHDQLPKHLQLVAGSVRWIYADGTTGQNRDVVQSDTDLFTKYVKFGDTWEPGDDFYVRFDTTALDNFEGCEVTANNAALTHNAQHPNDIKDTASVKIVKPNCAPPKPPVKPAAKVLPKTGPGDAAGLFAAVTAIGTVAYRLRLARKLG